MDCHHRYLQKTKKRIESFIPVLFLCLLVIVSTPTHADKTSYSIQVGAFKELRWAINEVDKLETAGLHVFYRREDIGKAGVWYRVYVEKYPEREEAVREAKRLRQLRLIDDFAIKIISEAEAHPSKTSGEEAVPKLVISKITLSQEKGGTETLMIHSNRFFWPSVLFSLDEEIPTLAVEIKNAESFGKILSDPTLHGDLIKVIRNPVQKKGKGVKILLSLAADRAYEVTQAYDEAENIFNLIVGLKNR